MTDWNDLVFRFRNQALTRYEWTHEAHLIVALWFLLEYESVERALPNFRSALILLNRSFGKANANPHETITGFWLREIDVFIRKNESRDFSILAIKLLEESAFFERDYIRRFYSKEVLSNLASKTTYIAP